MLLHIILLENVESKFIPLTLQQIKDIVENNEFIESHAMTITFLCNEENY